MEYAETIRPLFPVTPFIGDADPSTPAAATNTQLFPFVLSPDVTTLTSTSGPPVPVQATCHSFADPVKNSMNEVVAFLDSSTHVSASSVHGKTCDTTGIPSIGNPTSSLIASIVNRGVTPSSTNTASVIVSPQVANTSLSSIRPTTTNTGPTNSCSILLETSILSSQLSTSQRTQNPASTPSTSTCGTIPASSSLLVSSSGPTVPRFVIHKPSISHVSSTFGTGVADSYPLTLVAATTKAFTVDTISSTTAAPLLSDTSACNQPIAIISSKPKLVTSPNPSGIRLLTSPPSKPTAPASSTGLLHTNALTSLQPLISPLKTGISGPVGIWSGVNNTPAVQPSHLLTVQTSHPLMVQSSSDTLDDLSVAFNQVSSHSTPTATSSLAYANCPVSESAPTVLAFSLTTTTSMGVSGANLINKSATQHVPAASLVLRATCSPAVAISALPSTPTSMAHYTPTSLLKPFNFSLSGSTGPGHNTASTSVTSTTVVTPSAAVPIHIAPAKPLTLQAAPSSTISVNRSHLSTTLSPIPIHRHTSGSLFSQPNRRRARKQQLACALPNSTSSTPTGSVAPIPPLNVSSTSTHSSIPIAQLASSANRTTSTYSPSVVAIAKPAQPQLSVQPRHITAATHNVLSLPLSPKHGGGELAVKVACSVGLPVIPTINGTNSALSNPAGFVGIRLLSVRPTSVPTSIHPCSLPVISGSTAPSNLLSSRPNVNAGSDPTPVVVVAPTPVSSVCPQQIRIANPHPSPASDVHPPTAATVYVLTSSAYPVASGSSSSITVAQTTAVATASGDNRSTTVAPSSTYTTAVMLPSGETSGVLQVRFRPPFSHPAFVSSTSTSNFTPFILDPVANRPGCHLVRSTFHANQHQNASISLSSPSTEAVQSKPPPDTVGSPPAASRASSSSGSTSLLHRHLLSPQNPIHTELFLDRGCSAVGRECTNDSPARREGERDRPALEPELSTCAQDRFLKSDSADPVFEATVDNIQHMPPLKSSHMCTQGSSTSTAAAYVAVGEQEESSNEPPSKRLKGDNGPGSSILESVMHPQDINKSGVLSAVDPSTGCQWVIRGMPTRPSIMPKLSNRGGTVWRAKSSHFLSHLEIRSKCESRFDGTRYFRPDVFSRSSVTERGASLSSSVGRRRRRTSFQRDSGDAVSEVASASHVSAVRRRLLHDLLSSMSREKELQIVQSPLVSPSILSVSGSRALTCANNLDLLLYSERQTLSFVESLVSRLDSVLHQCSYSVASSEANRGRFMPLPPQQLSPSSAINNPGCTTGQGAVLETLATATTTSLTAPSAALLDCLDAELKKSLEKAVDLCKGISQRKCLLLQSIRHVQLLTNEIVEHFRADAIQCVRDLEEQFSAITPTRTGGTDSDLKPGSVSCRRSARTSATVSGTMRRPRVCDTGSSPYPVVATTSSPSFTNPQTGSAQYKLPSHDVASGGCRR